MFVTMRRFKLLNGADVNDVIRRVRADLVPALRKISGYQGYRVIDFRDGSFGSVGVYKTEHGANLANRVASETTFVRFSDILIYTSMKTFRTLYDADGCDGGLEPACANEGDARVPRMLAAITSSVVPAMHDDEAALRRLSGRDVMFLDTGVLQSAGTA